MAEQFQEDPGSDPEANLDSGSEQFAEQIEILQQAASSILEKYPDSPAAAQTVRRYLDQIEAGLSQDGPIAPAIVAGNENLLPLQEAVATINEQRGFTPERIEQHYIALEQAEALRADSAERLERVTMMWGGWSGLSEDLHSVFSTIEEGINAGELPGLSEEQLVTLGMTLNGALRAEVEQIYSDHGRLLTIPEVEVRSITAAEQVERFEDRLRAQGIHLVTETASEVGHGSEGVVFRVEATDGSQVAIKMKHCVDVSPVSDALTVVGAVSSEAAPYSVRAVEIYYEDRDVCAMEFIPEAPDLQTLVSFVVNDVVPEDTLDAEKVASFVHGYTSANPDDQDMNNLKGALASAITYLDNRQQSLATSPEWSAYFGAVENPMTAKPVNFLVAGIRDGKPDLVCVDPR